MTAKRTALAIVAAFVVSQILAIVVHGFVLASDYKPFYGTLLRPMSTEASAVMLLLPLSHLSMVAGLVWVYGRMQLAGSTLTQGMKLGLVAYFIGSAPLWMLWFAEAPWPASIVGKQLSLELVSSLVIGATIAVVARKPEPEPSALS